MVKNLQRISLILLTAVYGWFYSSQPLSSQTVAPKTSCPEDPETLIELMLQDIPSYANRVIQRSQRRSREVNQKSYVIVAGKPEFEPLTVKNTESFPFDPDTATQVFFSTLERQYSQNRAVDLQNFYWLFLAQTKSGWRLVRLYVRLASLRPGDIPLPPQENSNGIMGQAIRLWLRDCRAGTLR